MVQRRLFNDDDALPLNRADVKVALKAANQDWANIDPSIMGTLLERGTDPSKRSQLGMHYTDPEKIMMIVNPVVIEPLLREWEGVKADLTSEIGKSKSAKTPGARTAAFNRGRELKTGFIERLKAYRILDPACGSGNFLYLGLKALKDIEHRVNTECETLGLPRGFPVVGPENVLGIEINSFAAELARVSVWIGEIQWMREHGFDASRDPILKPLDTIQRHDALLNDDGTEYEWPPADAIIGNPPFLGDKRMLAGLGEPNVERLRRVFSHRRPGGADLVMYWFTKAAEQLAQRHSRVGFVATQSVRRGASNEVLKAVVRKGRIFSAYEDEEWTVDGADVRVSVICFDAAEEGPATLNGLTVPVIHADLTASAANISLARRLSTNTSAFIGDQKTGPFDVDGDVARTWIRLPLNPNGLSNSAVLRPWANGNDLVGRHAGKWIIDFGVDMSEANAALFEAPFQHVEKYVRSQRIGLREIRADKSWWLHQRPRPEMRRMLTKMNRYIATPRVSKHRVFAWVAASVLPDSRLVAIARDDDTSFGLLHSKPHEIWTLRLGGWHGVGNDPQYTPSLGFETFPFPEGLTPNIPPADYASDPRAIAIAAAAKRLDELRENWLNPADLVRRVPEVVAGYPDRILPVDDNAALVLKKRTLTNLYNERPSWLDHAHRDLDAAVASAYGWTDWGAGLADDVILERLFQLNQERAAGQ